MKDQHSKQEFKYLSEERVREVYRVFEVFKQANTNYFLDYNGYFYQGLRETNKPYFKKFSILRYEGIAFKLISTS